MANTFIELCAGLWSLCGISISQARLGSPVQGKRGYVLGKVTVMALSGLVLAPDRSIDIFQTLLLPD